MIKLLLIVYLTFSIGHLSINAQSTSVKDSLWNKYESAPKDSTCLDILHDIARLHQQSPVFLYYENKLLKEAKAQNSIRYQSIAIYEHIIYYYNRLDLKSVTRWMERMEDLAKKQNYYSDYFNAKKLQISMYTVNQQIELSIHEAEKMFQQAQALNSRNGMREACICLMTSYIATMRYEEGLQELDKAFKLINPEDNPMERVNLLLKAILAYSAVGDYKNMKIMIQLLEKAAEALIAVNPTLQHAYSVLFFGIEQQYAVYYNRTGNPTKAWEHLQKMEKYYTPTQFLPYRAVRLQAYAEYYQSIKEYNKALAYLDEAIQLISALAFPEKIHFSAQKADLLLEMGRLDEALPIYEKVMHEKDSLYRSLSESQMDEILSIYNINRLLIDKERRQTKFHHIILSTISIALLALILFVIRRYINQRKLWKDEKEMIRLNEMTEKANEEKGCFLTNVSYDIRIPLNNVVGFSQLLSTDTDLNEEERKEYSNIILTNSEQLIQLINDLLDLSRLEAQMMKFQVQEFNLLEVCNDLIGMVQLKSENQIQVQLITNIKEQTLKIDLNRFNQFVLTTFIYPTKCKEPRKVELHLSLEETNKQLIFHIINSPLGDLTLALQQQVIVKHKINRLFFEHFGGTYQTNKDSSITFTLPV